MDRDYGLTAFETYKRDILSSGGNLLVTAAVFAVLSPNSDYEGNLRSFRVVVEGFSRRPYRIPVDRLEGLGTYRHCAGRAYRLLLGETPDKVFGPGARKTYSFYRNILDPEDPEYVTIDGHMYNLWRGKRERLKASRIPVGAYHEIAGEFKEVARAVGVIPCQFQGTLWQCWRRTHKIRFDPQLELELELELGVEECLA
jgi:hypothetical protein